MAYYSARPFWPLLSCIALMGLVGIPNPTHGGQPKPLCTGSGLRVEINFARAGAKACSIRRIAGRAEITIQIAPETDPINPSPWYGMRLMSRRAQSVNVTLNYGAYKHRYHPHIATQIGNWTRVAGEHVATHNDGSTARIALNLAVGATFLAGQPFEPPALMTQFLDEKVTANILTRTNFGQSVAGIPLTSYQSTSPTASGTLILLTRQHPPEVAGEWAFDAFVAAIVADTDGARAFRNRFGILILPIINPDGLAKGYWRSNSGLVDLNRDWGPFTQPETKAAAAHILAATATTSAIAMIDFHATNRDVIYAQPASAALVPTGLVDNWLSAWVAALGPSAPKIDRAHNASNANSKTWGRINLGIAAITYEVGDDTPKLEAEARARLAAELFMSQAMAMPATTATLSTALPNTINGERP